MRTIHTTMTCDRCGSPFDGNEPCRIREDGGGFRFLAKDSTEGPAFYVDVSIDIGHFGNGESVVTDADVCKGCIVMLMRKALQVVA